MRPVYFIRNSPIMGVLDATSVTLLALDELGAEKVGVVEVLPGIVGLNVGTIMDSVGLN